MNYNSFIPNTQVLEVSQFENKTSNQLCCLSLKLYAIIISYITRSLDWGVNWNNLQNGVMLFAIRLEPYQIGDGMFEELCVWERIEGNACVTWEQIQEIQ